MSESMLFGVTMSGWRKMIEWAGETADLSSYQYDNPAMLDRLLAVHRKWLESGGPMSGPSGAIVL